jgi:hypothetical protein
MRANGFFVSVNGDSGEVGQKWRRRVEVGNLGRGAVTSGSRCGGLAALEPRAHALL